jgi:hypothetical protein
MRKQRFLALLLLALSTALLAVAPVVAKATRTQFEAIEATCNIVPGDVTVTGNVLHIRGQINTNRVIASDVTQTGTNTVVVNVDLNLVNGHGAAYGTFSLDPDAFTGTWEGSFSGHISRFVFTGQAVGHGTGDLSGQKVMVDLQDIEPATLPENPCAPGPVLRAGSVSGVVLNPHGG